MLFTEDHDSMSLEREETQRLKREILISKARSLVAGVCNMVTRDSASKQIVCPGTFGPHRPWKRNAEERSIQRSDDAMQLHRTCKVDDNAPVNCMHTPAHCSPRRHLKRPPVSLAGGFSPLRRTVNRPGGETTLTVGKVKLIESRISPHSRDFTLRASDIHIIRSPTFTTRQSPVVLQNSRLWSDYIIRKKLINSRKWR